MQLDMMPKQRGGWPDLAPDEIDEADPRAAAIAHYDDPDWYDLAARRKLNAPEQWRWHTIEAIGPDTLVTGSVPVGKRRDGQPKWGPRVNDQRAVVTRADVKREQTEWSAATGKCALCCGHGWLNVGMSVKWGRRYRVCRACNNTGAAPTGATGGAGHG